MGLLSRLKSLFGGGSKQNNSRSGGRRVVVKSKRTPKPIVRNGNYSRRSFTNALMGKEEERPRYKSMAESVRNTSGAKTKASSLLKTDGREKANASREGARARLDEIKKAKQEREDWHKATNHRYDVNEKGISDEERKKRRQNIKSRAFNADTAVAEAKHAMKYHKKSESFARGALSGATFGASDLVAKKSLKGEAKKAEEVYQKNKSKGYEIAGEIAGSLAGFGLTANATEKAGAKVARKVAPKAAAKLSSSKVAKAIGTDVAQNLTTGALYDVNKASAEHEVGSKEWWEEIGKSAALNAAVTGAVGVGSVVKSSRQAAKGAKEAAERLTERRGAKVTARELAERASRRADDATERVNIRDMARENERRFDQQVEDAVTVEDFEEFGLPRDIARILAEDRAERTAGTAVRDIPTVRRGISRGNIKPLAEKLRTDELMPRQRNAEWRIPPRSAERMDTSVEGLARQLDELRGQTGQTDRERRAAETKIHDVEDRLNRAKWRREGGSDMEAMKKAYRGEYAGFDMSKSTNGYQSDALEGKLKGKTATVVEMSPDEYMERAYRQIFRKPSEKGRTFADIPEHSEDIAKYAEAMRNGEKFPLPYLDYTSAGQEGRHRALAAKAAGIDRIPVVIIDSESNPKAIIDEVAEATSKEDAIRAYISEDVPYAGVDEPMPATNPQQTALNEAREDVERKASNIADEATEREPLKVNKVAEDKAAGKGLPSGVKQVRNAYEYTNNEKIEDGVLTSWNEAWQASKKYSESHATGKKNRMSKVAVSQLNAMDSEAERELRERLVESGDLNYEAISTPEMYDKVAKQLCNDADRYVKEMIEINEGGALDFRSTPEWQARVQYIMGTIDPSADAASEIAYTEAFKLAQNISSKGGQVLNLRKNFVHLTDIGKRDAILDDLINILYKSKGFLKEHGKDMPKGMFDRRNYIRKFLMEDDAIKDGVEKVVKAGELDDVSEAFAELMLNLNKKNPKTAFDVVQELRYLNMLGNPKTHIRNVFGSGFFSPMRQISNAIRSAIEEPISKAVGTETVRHGGLSASAAIEARAKKATSQAGEAAFESFKKVRKELLGSAKYETPTMTGRGKTAAGKLLDKLSDFNSNLLMKEDDHFKEIAFKENYIKSYNRYLKDGKPITEKVKRQIEQEAFNEAQIATFNEYNGFAKWLSSITRNATDVNATPLQRAGGTAVNAIMPFTKVPANIMKQSINYSPLGIARGLSGIKSVAKSGDAVALNRAIDQLASGMTGTGIFGLGMLLGKTTDMFTTNAGKNDPAAKFKKQQGVQNYSVTFKDPATGETHSYTLDWLVPASSVFFAGIELANQMKEGDFNLFDFGGDWADVTSRLAEPVMETSMLSGLHSMLETMRGGYGDDDTKGAISILLRETAQSYINSLVPTIMGQAARTAYKTDMQLPQDVDWGYFRNQLKSKTGLANSNILGEPLGADTDAYGNVKGEKKSAEDYLKSAAKNFLSPANIQKVDLSELDQEKLRIYEDAVKNGADPTEMDYLFPKKQYKKQFDVADEKVQMSNRDVSTYNQAKTKGGAEGMRYVLEGIMFNRYDKDSKGKKTVLRDGYTKEQKAKLIKQFDGKSIREVEEWLYKQPQFRSASEAEQRKVIKGLWTLTNQGKSNAAKRVGEQAVYKAQGKDVNEYNFKNEVSEKKRNNLQSYIDSGLITYADAVDFAREAGKTYYYEDDEGGHSQTYFNKAQMMEYLDSKGYTDEQKAALFNSFKASNAKEYGSSSRRGRRGYGRRGYRRRGGGGGSSGGGVPKGAKSMAATLNKGVAKKTKVKLEPPMLKVQEANKQKLKKYKV